jgi:uncharacterized protein YndB with AHSA1/START domain
MTSNNNISIQQEFEVSPPLLWKYLTQLEHMKKWFFAALTSFEPTRGFKTFYTFQYNNKTFTHQWEVREVIMQEKLCLGWQYKEYPGDSEAIFEISSSPKGCILKLTATILSPFPEMEEFSRESMQSGCTDLIQTRLKAYVNSL